MRNLSQPIRSSLQAWYTDEVYLALLTLTHPDVPQGVHLANNDESITSNGQEFIGFPFEISLPSEDDNFPRAQLTVQNIDRVIGRTLMPLTTPMRAKIQVVLFSDPDDVWLEYKNFYLRSVTGNAYTVSGEIDTWDFGSDPWPARRATKDRFPSLFR